MIGDAAGVVGAPTVTALPSAITLSESETISNGVTLTFTAATTKAGASVASTTVEVASATGIAVGMALSFAGVSGSPVVTVVAGTTITVDIAQSIADLLDLTFTKTTTTVVAVTSSPTVPVASLTGIAVGAVVSGTGVTGTPTVTGFPSALTLSTAQTITNGGTLYFSKANYSYASDAITLNTAANSAPLLSALTAAEANASTGDYREVVRSILSATEANYTAIDQAYRPTYFSIRKSRTLNADGTVAETYTVAITADASVSNTTAEV